MSDFVKWDTAAEHLAYNIWRYDPPNQRALEHAQHVVAQIETAQRLSKEFIPIKRSDLQAIRDELNRWGHGDFHYGPQEQEQSVVDAVAKCDEYLNVTER